MRECAYVHITVSTSRGYKAHGKKKTQVRSNRGAREREKKREEAERNK